MLDEATSALDQATERAVMDSIWELGRNITVVMVAHRLSTTSRCDRIIEMQAGKIIAVGSHEEMVTSYSDFGLSVSVDAQRDFPQ